MEIKKAAVAGTLESSDCMVTIRPGNGTVDIQLDSDVKVMFGNSILATVQDTLTGLGIEVDAVPSANFELPDDLAQHAGDDVPTIGTVQEPDYEAALAAAQA